MNNYRTYMVALLAFILAFNYVDRLALGLVLQNIKLSFDLSDTELGVLSGIAFALFYATLGMPIGRWADRGNRVTIIAVAAALWSVMVMLSGAAKSFVQLLVVRIGVAVGEAGCMPPAYSLIGDYYTRAERPQAVANYLLGGSISLIVGYFVAGWLNQFYGWKVMFAILGVPGTVLAVLAWLTLREPRVTKGDTETAVIPGAPPPVSEVCRILWTNKTFRHVLLMQCINYLFGLGISQWQPAFFIRSYGLKTGELGTVFALVYGVGGFIGTYYGGRIASRQAARNERLQLRALALLNANFGIISAFVYLSHNAYVAFGLISLGALVGALGSGPLFATIQTVVPERMRAISFSVVFLFVNLIGMGLGPYIVGALSDALRPWLGVESLRYALLAMCPGYLWGGWHLWCASDTVAEDAEVASKQDAASCGRSTLARSANSYDTAISFDANY